MSREGDFFRKPGAPAPSRRGSGAPKTGSSFSALLWPEHGVLEHDGRRVVVARRTSDPDHPEDVLFSIEYTDEKGTPRKVLARCGPSSAQPEAREGSCTSHLMRGAAAVCATFRKLRPNEWPEGHMQAHTIATTTCPECLTAGEASAG